MISQLARDLASIAHAHYVTPSTTDQGPGEALAERIQERLKEASIGEYKFATQPEGLITGHEATENECVAMLLKGIPDEGGSASKAVFESLIRMAFQGGLTSALGRKAVET